MLLLIKYLRNAFCQDLSLWIKDKGIKLCEKQEEAPPEIIGLAVTSALIAYKSGNKKKAKYYKDIAERYKLKGDMYRYSFPAMSREDHALYRSIK